MTAAMVRPVRFTNDVAAMRRFLELLGMRARTESRGGGWVDLVAGAGMVALHSVGSSTRGAQSGQTTLSLEVGDPDSVAERLRAAGFSDAEVVDESYGRDVLVTDPDGDQLLFNGVSNDLYGYQRKEAAPDPSLTVSPTRFTDPTGPYRGFLEALGLRAVDGGTEHFAPFEAQDAGGEVNLHVVYAGELPVVDAPGAVHLTFTTREPMADLAARLASAGFTAEVVHEDFGSHVSVTDPDDQSVQIYEAR
ncbi:hypothetical protein [Lapillicoccus sp.]|uniref:VOC family protein n=1 Tax=Lapillicoccus sp. TaxID=1909287 RepID=UPI0032674FD7